MAEVFVPKNIFLPTIFMPLHAPEELRAIKKRGRGIKMYGRSIRAQEHLSANHLYASPGP